MTGLATGAFIVREDDIAREVLSVSTATAPMQIALLVDTSQGDRQLSDRLPHRCPEVHQADGGQERDHAHGLRRATHATGRFHARWRTVWRRPWVGVRAAREAGTYPSKPSSTLPADSAAPQRQARPRYRGRGRAAHRSSASIIIRMWSMPCVKRRDAAHPHAPTTQAWRGLQPMTARRSRDCSRRSTTGPGFPRDAATDILTTMAIGDRMEVPSPASSKNRRPDHQRATAEADSTEDGCGQRQECRGYGACEAVAITKASHATAAPAMASAA